MEEPTANPEFADLVRAIVRATKKRDRARHVRLLAQVPADVAAPEIIAQLKKAETKNEFFRLCNLLAEFGGEIGVEHLLREARENDRFPRHPIRAIAHSKHPNAVPVLIELLKTGKARQRRSALIALGECGHSEAIEPLCIAASADRRWELQAEALKILQRMGRPRKLALRVLQDPRMTDAACARALAALAVMPVYSFPLSFSPFDGERLLERLTGRGSALAARAQAVLSRLREQRTLLRAAMASQEDTLLRAAAGGGSANPDELVRATLTVQVESTTRKVSWWRRNRRS